VTEEEYVLKEAFNLQSLDYLPYIITEHDVVISVGYAFMNLTEYSKEELINKSISQIFEMLRISICSDTVAASDKSNGFLFTKRYECRQVIIIRKPGLSSSSMIYVFLEKPDSRLEYKFPVVHHLCEENMFGVALFSYPDIILLKASQAWLDFFGEPYNKKENSLGKFIGDIIANWKGSTFEEIWNTVLKTGATYRNKEYKHENSQKEVIYLDISITPIYEHGQLRYFVEITSDITDRILDKKRIEEQALIIEQKNYELEKALKMKEEYFSFMSHEFKTPLTIINTAVQALESLCGDEMSNRAKAFIRKIRQNSFRQLRLINNILDITRADGGYLKINKKNADIISMTNAITESVALYAREKGINLTFSSEVDKKIIAIDDEKYERILLNILSNAFKFTPRGKSVHVNIVLDEKYVCIEVKDEGIGIPEEKQVMIFERFKQVDSSLVRNSEGTGIGLSLVKLLVEAMGGKISVESEEGSGSTFRIWLPDTVVDEEDQLVMECVNDYRLIQAIDIEFSDIYSS